MLLMTLKDFQAEVYIFGNANYSIRIDIAAVIMLITKA